MCTEKTGVFGASKGPRTTLVCKEALHLVNGCREGEYHGVVSRFHRFPAGRYDNLTVTQDRSDEGSFGEPHLGERPAGDLRSFWDSQLYHLGSAFE